MIFYHISQQHYKAPFTSFQTIFLILHKIKNQSIKFNFKKNTKKYLVNKKKLPTFAPQ